MEKAPVVVLSNGIKVANFSSPHPFNFQDGNVLEACAPERVKAGALDVVDVETDWPGLPGVRAVTPHFRMNVTLYQLLQELEDDVNVDVILIPFPVLEALRRDEALGNYPKAATIRVADRTTKAIYIDRFCR